MAICGNRLVATPLFIKRNSKVVMSLDKVGFDMDRLVVGFDRFVEFSLFFKVAPRLLRASTKSRLMLIAWR